MRLRCPGRRGVHSGFLRDVSRGGMFLRLVDPEDAGARVGFEVSLPGRRQRVRGTGEVAWSRPSYEGPGRPPGMAVRFLTLEIEGARELTELLGVPPRADVELVRSVVPEPPEPGAEREAETAEEPGTPATLDSGAELEMTAEPWASATAAAGPEPEPETVPADPPPPAGGEAPEVASTVAASAAATPAERPSGSQGGRPGRRALLAAAAAAVLIAVLIASSWIALRGSRDAATADSSRRGGAAPPAAGAAGPGAPADGRGDAAAPAGVVPRAAEPVAELPPEPATAIAALPPATQLADARWQPLAGGGTRLVLTFDGALDPERVDTSSIGGEAPRLLLQIRGVRTARPGARWEPATGELRAVRTGFHPDGDGGELHVVLDLARGDVELAELRAAGAELRCDLAAAR